MTVERRRIGLERYRVEREWIEARAEKDRLRSGVAKALREAVLDPMLKPSPSALESLMLARQRCKALDEEYLALMELERQQSDHAV